MTTENLQSTGMHPIMLMRLLSVVVIATGLSANALADIQGWSQVWSDEFDGTVVDSTKWNNEIWTAPYNNEQQAYVPQQATVGGGNLTITATNQPYAGKQYRSARLESKYANQYGRWEIKAKLPSTKGTWPAIWLLPNVDQYNWPTQGEIDILENRGQQPNLTSSAFHYVNASGDHQWKPTFNENTSARFGQPVNYHDGFHTYAVEWDDKKIRFFVDDVNWMTLHDAEVNGKISNNAPMETVLNVAVGGDFLGGAGEQPDGSSVWPQQMVVDYVRVFERDANIPITMTNGDFEANNGSLAGWSRFGNRPNTNNVSIHDEAANGAASLKLFGQFTGGNNSSGVSQGISVTAGDEVQADLSRFIRSQDSITGTGNNVVMRIEFFNDFGGKVDTSAMLQRSSLTIANGSSPNNVWQDFNLNAVAPANAVEARLSLIFNQPANGGGAVHLDDVNFMNVSLAAGADFNLDGSVDADDLAIWQNGYGMETSADREHGDADGDGDVDGQDYLAWQRQVTAIPPLTAEALAVPEPSTAWAAIVMLLYSRLGRGVFVTR